MEAPTNLIRVFHLSAFLIYTYTVFHSIAEVIVPVPYPEFAYAGKAKFLTQWNLVSIQQPRSRFVIHGAIRRRHFPHKPLTIL